MPRFLVVDDSSVDRTLAGGALGQIDNAEVHFAHDGISALEQVALLNLDLVVTDIHMPRLDGLQLVQELTRKYPWLPVIVMTAQGSEDLVIQALELAAAGYVPKRRLIQELATTAERILSNADNDRQYSRVGQRLKHQKATFILENDVTLLVSLSKQLREVVHTIWQCDSLPILRIGMALEEALINACYHGNLELDSKLRDDDEEKYQQLQRQRVHQRPYSQRRITVSYECTKQFFRCVIRDEGAGFNPERLPDPFSSESLERPSGRGLTLIRAFTDEVSFNDHGNEITLLVRRPSATIAVTDHEQSAFPIDFGEKAFSV
ncbi:MAG: ATP-binding protein [Planctomycetia bacterium]|nr:ATP-binding protein [Planctomycetia bacterium]